LLSILWTVNRKASIGSNPFNIHSAENAKLKFLYYVD